jgi:voltage-gated sodium channel
VLFYSFVVITTNLFRDIDPKHYGTLGRSAAHLYTVMASFGQYLETEEPVLDGRPWVYFIFAPFIVVASFGLMSMFSAVLVAALKEQIERKHVQEERARFDRLEQKVDALTSAVRELPTSMEN